MQIIGYDITTGEISHVFEGEDPEHLVECAEANGCSTWLEVATVPDPRRWRVEGGTLVAKAENPAVALAARRAAMTITPRQLFIALAAPPFSFITSEEAVAAATTGVMPAAVDAAVSSLPSAQETAARITWARMQEVRRTDPMVELLAATQPGTTEEMLDAFFTFAAEL